MTGTRAPEVPDSSLTRDLLDAARYYLGGRQGLFALAVIALVGSVALTWSWLATAGIAPLLLGALPCMAMFALGLCLSRMSGPACSADAASPNKAERLPDEQLPVARVGTSGAQLERSGDALEIVAGAKSNPRPRSVAKRRTIDA